MSVPFDASAPGKTMNENQRHRQQQRSKKSGDSKDTCGQKSEDEYELEHEGTKSQEQSAPLVELDEV